MSPADTWKGGTQIATHWPASHDAVDGPPGLVLPHPSYAQQQFTAKTGSHSISRHDEHPQIQGGACRVRAGAHVTQPCAPYRSALRSPTYSDSRGLCNAPEAGKHGDGVLRCWGNHWVTIGYYLPLLLLGGGALDRFGNFKAALVGPVLIETRPRNFQPQQPTPLLFLTSSSPSHPL